MRLGGTRIVFCLWKIAIKVPRANKLELFLDGLNSNRRERRTWKKERSEFLCPVYFGDPFGFFLVMKRADYVFPPYDHPTMELTDEEQESLWNFFNKVQCMKICSVDPAFQNVGLFDGKKKLIDYGGRRK